jgi:hypothetical protein
MTITGLENNYYLINNEINVLINGFASEVKYMDIKFTNNYTGKVAEIRIYPINDVFKIDLSYALKSTFNEPLYPDVNLNLNEIEIEFKAFLKDETIDVSKIIKNCIRGGNYQGVYPDCVREKENYLQESDEIVYLISNTLPFWTTDNSPISPTMFYQLQNGEYYQFVRNPRVERFEIPCLGIKVVFLNQYGTYSEWYFNNYEITDATKHIDYIKKFNTDWNSNNNFNDIGVNVSTRINVKDSIPLAYNNLIRHLIVSKEIYVVEDGFMRKVINTNSKWFYNSREKNYKYSINFDYNDVLNPSDLC